MLCYLFSNYVIYWKILSVIREITSLHSEVECGPRPTLVRRTLCCINIQLGITGLMDEVNHIFLNNIECGLKGTIIINDAVFQYIII